MNIKKKLIYLFYRFFLSDEKAIKKQFKKRLNRLPELDEPKLFTDKLQWLKLNWYDHKAVNMADKYAVRKIVAEKIGEKYLNELYDVYESVDEIEFSNLPVSFVLKGTHGSGFNIICKNKYELDWKKEKKKMKKWLSENYFWKKREWIYKDIPPRIICEKLLIEKNSGENNLADYKFYCFQGKPHYCQVIRGRGGQETIDFFNMEWEHLPFTGMRILPNSQKEIYKPKGFNTMVKLAEILAENFPFVRVDFYYVNESIIFGEMTFFPTSGMGKFEPANWDKRLGDLVVLPKTN